MRRIDVKPAAAAPGEQGVLGVWGELRRDAGSPSRSAAIIRNFSILENMNFLFIITYKVMNFLFKKSLIFHFELSLLKIINFLF